MFLTTSEVSVLVEEFHQYLKNVYAVRDAQQQFVKAKNAFLAETIPGKLLGI